MATTKTTRGGTQPMTATGGSGKKAVGKKSKAEANKAEAEAKRATAKAELEEIGKEISAWPAPGFKDTELGVLMEPEVCHGEAEVYAGVQA